MGNVDRTRIIFIAIIGISAILICGFLSYGFISDRFDSQEDEEGTATIIADEKSTTYRNDSLAKVRSLPYSPSVLYDDTSLLTTSWMLERGAITIKKILKRALKVP